MSVILVSHDLGVIAQTCDRVAVMYAGQIVELADTATLLTRPRHPYTIGLLRSLPGHRRGPLPAADPRSAAEPDLDSRRAAASPIAARWWPSDAGRGPRSC